MFMGPLGTGGDIFVEEIPKLTFEQKVIVYVTLLDKDNTSTCLLTSYMCLYIPIFHNFQKQLHFGQ
jgi:hypothetical protein